MSDGGKEEYRFTYVEHVGEGIFPFRTTGFIYHRKDLSDLGEPYLTMVKEALASREVDG